MKNVPFSNRRTSPIKNNQQMLQALESRRLMSVTTGFDVAPVHPAMTAALAIHADHIAMSPRATDLTAASFSTPAQSSDSPSAGGFHWVQMDGQFNDQAGDQSAEFQIAHAIASGIQIAIVPQTENDFSTAAVADNSDKPASISELYSTIGTSTVSEIDNATAVSTTAQHAKISAVSTLDNLLVDTDATGQTSKATAQPEQSDAAAAAPVVETASTSDAGLLLASIAAPVQPETPANVDLGLMAVDSRPDSSTETQTSDAIPSRDALQSLENELQAVRSHSRQIAQTLGQDHAVMFAQAQMPMVNSQPAADSPSGWKTYAATVGAAIATIVYAHHEIVRGKVETRKLFSSKAISYIES